MGVPAHFPDWCPPKKIEQCFEAGSWMIFPYFPMIFQVFQRCLCPQIYGPVRPWPIFAAGDLHFSPAAVFIGPPATREPGLLRVRVRAKSKGRFITGCRVVTKRSSAQPLSGSAQLLKCVLMG